MADGNTQELDNYIKNLYNKINLNLINPINLEEEKNRFFSGKIENPRFMYPEHTADFKREIEILSFLHFKDSPIGMIYREKADELINFLKMFEQRGKKDFTKYSIKIFGQLTEGILSEAKKLSRLNISKIYEPRASLSTEQAVELFRRELRKLNFNWAVQADSIVANAMVIPAKRIFVIRNNQRFSRLQARRFIAHEIYGHILRAECGLLQPHGLFYSGLADYESTEEGLALYKEMLAGLLNKQGLKGYAGRILAIETALSGSFRKTFDTLCRFYSKKQAWTLTVRVKRGLEDTSQPGAFTKDLAYLKGFIEVSKYAKKYGTLHDLHYGKIAVEHAQYMPEIEGLKNPDILLGTKDSDKIIKRLFW